MRAMFIALEHIFGSSQTKNEEKILYGLAASKGVYEGSARRVSGPSEFGLIAKGDVLVTESTTEAFNILLPLLGGIVTDNGGLLSHAAIVSREYGIPGVVGTREATEKIANGVRVRVDGDAGEVTVSASGALGIPLESIRRPSRFRRMAVSAIPGAIFLRDRRTRASACRW